MWVYWLVYLLLLPLAPFGIAVVAALKSLQMSKHRWIVHSLASLLIALIFPIYREVGLILNPSIGDMNPEEGVGFVEGAGTLLNMYNGSATLIGYATFAWCTRRRPRTLGPAS